MSQCDPDLPVPAGYRGYSRTSAHFGQCSVASSVGRANTELLVLYWRLGQAILTPHGDPEERGHGDDER